MYVGKRMTPNPITARPETTYNEAMALLRDHRIRRLPVLKDGKLVGLVEEKDLLANQPSPATTLSVYEMHTLLDRLTLRQIMSTPVLTVAEDCPLEEAARIMMQNAVGCLPVLRDGALVGIITQSDVFRALIDVLGVDDDGNETFQLSLSLEDKPGALSTVTRAIANVGGNIENLVTFPDAETNTTEIYIKVHGASLADLQRVITEDAAADLLDSGPATRYEPRPVGEKKP